MADRPGRPGHRDPLAGIGGAAPARSALTLRLVLALLGLLSCAVIAVALFWSGHPVLGAVATVFAAIAVADAVVILHRRRAGN